MRSYSLSPCQNLENVSFGNCGLTSVDVDSVPDSVQQFYCQRNKISDTSAIVERFGEDSVTGQFSNYSTGVNAISDGVANGYLTVGSSIAVSLVGKYSPASSDQYFSREDRNLRNAAANYSVESDDPGIISCRITDDPDYGALLALEGRSAGTATVRVHYKYVGQFGTYEDTQVADVTVSDKYNHVASIETVDSLLLNAVTDCAICSNLGIAHEETPQRLASIVLCFDNPSCSATAGQRLRVSSSDESVASAFASWDGVGSSADLFLVVGKLGDAVLTISVVAGDGVPTGVEKTVSVHANEQKPVLKVLPEVTVVKSGGTYGNILGNTASDASCPPFAYFEDNGALDALRRFHTDINSSSCSTSVPGEMQFVTFTSDNEEVISFPDNIHPSNGYTASKAGTANVTIQDIWGNKGTCKVTVKDVSDVISKLYLTEDSITVKQGQQIDLEQYIGGVDSLTTGERDAIGSFAYVSGNNSIAAFKCDDPLYGDGSILGATKMVARNTGDVVVKLCYSDGYLNSNMYYNNHWTPIEIDSMTIHVVESGSKVIGQWKQSGSRWWYDNGDGTYPRSCWREIDGSYYHFDVSGYMQTGWLALDGSWYYLSGSGAMATGWHSVGGTWYWFDDSGAMATGWKQIDGTWYHFAGSGAMQTGWLALGGTWYYLSGSGAMSTGWQSVGGTWYWFNDGGAMATGWAAVDGTWYLFNGSGAMLTGWQKAGGTWYWFAGSGSMVTGWQRIGGTWYWFDGSGAMATGWFKVDGTYYYADGSGAMQSSRWVGDYYLTGSGAMMTNGFTPDGYYVGRDGAWQYIYWTPNGGAYHKTKDCPSLSRSTNIISGTLSGAGNRTACKNCWH